MERRSTSPSVSGCGKSCRIGPATCLRHSSRRPNGRGPLLLCLEFPEPIGGLLEVGIELGRPTIVGSGTVLVAGIETRIAAVVVGRARGIRSNPINTSIVEGRSMRVDQ